MTIFLFVLGVAAVFSVLYLSIMYSSIPGAVDERLGKLEEVPTDLGQWVEDKTSEAGRRASQGGKRREVRTLLQAGGFLRREHFVVQGRLKNPETGEVESVEPEQRVPRRRHKG